MNPVLPLPGEGCRHWVAGRCLYEESVNPGLMREFACTVLAALEKSFDEFIDRGEMFGLSVEEAGRIWAKRADQALNIGWDCASFTLPQDDPGDTACLHFLEGLCVLRLPPCPGRCRRYESLDRRRTHQTRSIE